MTVVADRPAVTSSFLRSTSQLLAGNVASQVILALTFAVIARACGRETFGLVVTLMGVAAVGQDLLDFGTSQWLSREIAAGRVASAAARDLLGRRLSATSFVCVVAVGATVAAGAPPLVALGTAVYVVCAVANAGTHAQLRADGRFRRSAVHATVERILWLAAVLIVVPLHLAASAAAAAMMAAMGVAYASSAFALPERRPSARFAPRGLASTYRRAASFGLMGLSSDLQQVDAALAAGVGSVGTAASVGLASKLSSPVALVAGSVSQVAFRGVSVGGPERRHHARTAFRVSVGMATAFALVVPALPALTVALLGHEYAGARAAVLVYGVGTALSILNQPMAAVLAARGDDRWVARSVTTGVVVGLTSGALLVPGWGAAGMGCGYLLTQVLILGSLVTRRWRPCPSFR